MRLGLSSPYEPEGREFESLRARHTDTIAAKPPEAFLPFLPGQRTHVSRLRHLAQTRVLCAERLKIPLRRPINILVDIDDYIVNGLFGEKLPESHGYNAGGGGVFGGHGVPGKECLQPATEDSLCRELCRNPRIPARVGLCRRVSLRNS